MSNSSKRTSCKNRIVNSKIKRSILYSFCVTINLDFQKVTCMNVHVYLVKIVYTLFCTNCGFRNVTIDVFGEIEIYFVNGFLHVTSLQPASLVIVYDFLSG